MSERSQPRRVGLQNVCIFLERNGDWGVYPCFDSADSLARVRMLRAVSCRVHSVTLAWPTFYRKDSLASGESHGIRFRHSELGAKDERSSWCWASAVCARKRRPRPAMSPCRH